jgi:hypothetical protein
MASWRETFDGSSRVNEQRCEVDYCSEMNDIQGSANLNLYVIMHLV